MSLARFNLTFDEDIQFEGTRTVDLCRNLVAVSGDQRMQAESADGSFAGHPATSESRSKSRTNVQRRFGMVFRTDWYGSLANYFLPFALRTGTKMVGPGVSKVVSYLTAIALADGASVFIVSNTGAVTMSPTGGVALISPAILSVVGFNSEEPIENLLFPNFGSTSEVYSYSAFSFDEQSVAFTEKSRMVKVMVCGMRVVLPSGQRDRAHVPAPGSSSSRGSYSRFGGLE